MHGDRMKKIIKVNYRSIFKYEEHQETVKYDGSGHLEIGDDKIVVSYQDENKIKIELSETSFEKVLTDECKNKVIQLLNLIPSGIQTMAADMPGLVESSINLGVVTTKENVMTFEATTRSSVETRKDYINNTVKLVAESLGADYEETDHYPSWERAIDSKLEEISIETYKKLTGNDPKILTIHAGLECGLFLKKMDGCEAISIGPNAYDVHTPNEHVSISSIKNVWDYLVACLESMNQH